MRRTLVLTAVLLLTVSLAWAQPPGGMPPAKVVVEKVVVKTVAKTSPFVGAVDFERLSDVSPEVPGRMASHSMREGGYVEKGAALATVDTELIEAEAAVLRSQLAEAQVRLENSARDLERADDLFKRGIISRQDYDALLYKKRALEKEAATTGERLARQELVIKKSTLTAPFSGIVLERYKDVGMWIKPEEPVCKLASTAEVFIRVNVPEDIVRFVGIGDKLSVALDALGRELTGEVYRVVPVAEVRTRNFAIKVRVPYISGMVQNMSASVQAPVSPKMELNVFRRDALVSMNGSDFVYTVKDGKAAMLPVKVAAYMGRYVGVEGPPLKPGMSVVVEGNERLMPGQPVAVEGKD